MRKKSNGTTRKKERITSRKEIHRKKEKKGEREENIKFNVVIDGTFLFKQPMCSSIQEKEEN